MLCHPPPARPQPEPAPAPVLVSSHIIPFSPPPPSPTNLLPPPFQLVCRHGSGEQYSPAISSPAVLLLPSFFISNRVWRWRGIQLADPASWPSCSGAQLARRPVLSRGRLVPPPFSFSSVSKCGPSTSSETIEKQRPKMRFPVSFPSLMNK